MFYVNRSPPVAAVNLNKTTYALRVPRNPRYGYAHPIINTDVSTTRNQLTAMVTTVEAGCKWSSASR
ncbi:hypothetical protein EVAR_99293_1 [Eumeta japonica]|uniref:Uncharacterized protein n=1 Tax=Eumeta variegata TaxID=151549 RepID=A0A4C2A507_EUMVA|nr:hypothetical protein EVAR_99293_1 [Eumeta japonica]